MVKNIFARTKYGLRYRYFWRKYGLGYRYFRPILISQACISQACTSQACISQACISQACISQACNSQASISQAYVYYPTGLLLNRPARCVLATGERDGQNIFARTKYGLRYRYFWLKYGSGYRYFWPKYLTAHLINYDTVDQTQNNGSSQSAAFLPQKDFYRRYEVSKAFNPTNQKFRRW